VPIKVESIEIPPVPIKVESIEIPVLNVNAEIPQIPITFLTEQARGDKYKATGIKYKYLLLEKMKIAV
jgi:hypothetical protein